MNRMARRRMNRCRTGEECHPSHAFDTLQAFVKLREFGVLAEDIRAALGMQRCSPIDGRFVVVVRVPHTMPDVLGFLPQTLDHERQSLDGRVTAERQFG